MRLLSGSFLSQKAKCFTIKLSIRGILSFLVALLCLPFGDIAQAQTAISGSTTPCVTNRSYAIVVSSTVSGTFAAVLKFGSVGGGGVGSWQLVAEDGSPGAGSYVASGTNTIQAAGIGEGYVGAFSATCNNSGITGAGFGSAGDIFGFAGSEISGSQPPTPTPTPNQTPVGSSQCRDGIDNDSDGKIDALTLGSNNPSASFTFPSRDSIRTFIYSSGAPILRLTSDEGDSPYPFLGTLEKICQLKGYQKVGFWTPVSTGGEFGVCYDSPSNNSILTSNELGEGFLSVDADVVGNVCVQTLTCVEQAAECADGKDNDVDGKIDFPADPGCEAANDLSEKPHDPKCTSPNSPTEFEQCRDTVDNDGDGLKDFPADPGCASPDDDSEENGGACTDVQMKIDFTDIANFSGGNAEAVLYLDNRKITVKNGEWFSLIQDGVSVVDSSFSIGSNQYSGIMGQRLANNKIRLAVVGNIQVGSERTEATISIKNGSFTALDFAEYQSSVFETPTNGNYNSSLFLLPGSDDEVSITTAKTVSLKSVVSSDSDPVTISYAVDNTCVVQCSDGKDNDGDGAVDFPSDFSCDSSSDNDESGPKAQCQDGLDNDADGAIDYPADFSCSSLQDNNETDPKSQCQDGIDNDGDGAIDLADPSCSHKQDDDETNPKSECQDWIDNDADGATDYPADFSCSSLIDNDETNPKAQCQDGLDNDGDGAIDLLDPSCSSKQDNDELSPKSQCQDGLDNDTDGAIDYPADFSCSSPVDNDETNPKAQCQDGLDNDGDGAIDLLDPSCSSKQDNDEGNTKTQCQDGIDNDLDSAIDYPADFSCASLTDDDESTPKSQCQDGIDNDGDSAIDLDDMSCSTKQDNDETNPKSQCQDGSDNDLDGAIDYPNDFSCTSLTDNDESNPKAQCQDGLDNDSDGAVDLEDPSCSSAQDNNEVDPKSQCQDGRDNDSDGSIDYPADFSCSSLSDDDETNPKSQCQDDADNDRDGAVDLQDFSCSSAQDNDEMIPRSQCQDGIDNDSDGVIDSNDTGCSSPQDDKESDDILSVIPVVDCVTDNANGTFTAYFGYENLNTSQVVVDVVNSGPVGLNYFSPEDPDRGQPRAFKSGLFHGVFSVNFDGGNLTWTVQAPGAPAVQVTASKNTNQCIPIVPRAECIEPGPTGQLLATFGYTNYNNFTLSIPVGPLNGFVPTPLDRGQPTSFLEGQVNSIFKVAFPDNSLLEWSLNGRSTTASTILPFCPGSEGCTMTPVVNVKSTLDELALSLSTTTGKVADRLVKLSKSQPSVVRDAKRAKKVAQNFLTEAQTLVFKVPDVVKSCPEASEFCARIDNQPTIHGLGSLYRRQWSQIKRIVARSQFRNKNGTRNRDQLFQRTKVAYLKGLETLKTIPRFATECE